MGLSASSSRKSKKDSKNKKEKDKKGGKKDYGKAGTPDAMKNEITDIYETFKKYKKKIEPLYHEKNGLTCMLNEERERLLKLLEKHDELKAEREPLLLLNWGKDADEIRRAFVKNAVADKETLVGILATRSKYQLGKISEIYQERFNISLLEQLVNDLTTTFGSIFTGKQTGLCNLLTFRVLSQPERDAALLRDFSDGFMGLHVDEFIEVVCTRSNEELRAAIDEYQDEYSRNLIDIVKVKSSRSFRDLLLKILECRRNEDGKPFDDETAESYAKELYDAGAGRLVGVDPEPFIRILGSINPVQFESIKSCYRDQKLLEDIKQRHPDNFYKAIVGLCTNKYEYMAKRLEQIIKAGDRDGVCR